ncbi:MAG: M28 family peptidase [Isosphaeraceae bacterium]
MQLVPSRPNSKPVPESIRGILAAISENDLREVVERISVPRPTGTPENEAVRRFVIELFSDTEFGRHGVKVDEAGNVVVGDPQRAKILIGAHYDSIPGTPGADDNASGVSAISAAARAIGPQEEVCYVAFDGEECGFVGSRALVGGLGRHRLEQVHVLEMVGYASRERGSQRNPISVIQAPAVGDFLGVVGTYGSRRLLDHVLATADCHAVPVQGLFLPDVPLELIGRISHHLLRSDHDPFWREGIPALMWTDTSEFRNPHYHLPTDTPETLDYEFLAGVTRLLVHAVLSGHSGWGRQ